MNGTSIEEAIEMLHLRYPHERTEIWAGYNPDGSERLSARIGDGSHGLPMIWGYGSDPLEAAQDAITKAGQRDINAIMDARIAKLRKELAELEARQTVEA